MQIFEKKCWLALFLGLSISTPASAMTVRELQVACVGMTDRTKATCEDYILGVVDGAVFEASLVGDKAHFCVPGGISGDKLVLLIRTAMDGDVKAHPQDSSMSAVPFIGAVMMKVFPCPNS